MMIVSITRQNAGLWGEPDVNCSVYTSVFEGRKTIHHAANKALCG